MLSFSHFLFGLRWHAFRDEEIFFFLSYYFTFRPVRGLGLELVGGGEGKRRGDRDNAQAPAILWLMHPIEIMTWVQFYAWMTTYNADTWEKEKEKKIPKKKAWEREGPLLREPKKDL